MKILHTSDWHLGKRLYNKDFEEDHQKFFEWLLQTVNNQHIEALIVSGDVFDTGYPSNSSLKLYYQILTKLIKTCCRYVIIVGGNHDSVSTLNAPKEILDFLNIKVLGGVPQNIEDLIIELADNQGNTELVVCAIPFLRDKDIRLSTANQTVKERNTEIRDGIKQFYKLVASKTEKYKEAGIQVIATGHLYMSGGKYSDSERDIFVGNLTEISGDIVDGSFDYVALGHLHSPQIVGNKHHIRFSGSPIALSFSEKEDNKSVVVIEAIVGKPLNISEISIPRFRKMIRFTGSFEDVKTRILAYKSEGCFKDLAELIIEAPSKDPFLVAEVNDFISNNSFDINIISPRINVNSDQVNVISDSSDLANLSDLKETEVFNKLLDFQEVNPEEKEQLNLSFIELMQWMNEKKVIK